MDELLEFEDAAAFGAWLEAHHDRATEAWVVINKRASGLGGPTWAQLVPEALRFGWIDGVSHPVDEHRRKQRFTPRRSTRWSRVNADHVARLIAEDRMHPKGLAAWEAREGEPYSLSDRPDQLPPELDAVLREDAAAGAFWDTTPPSYRKTVTFWITEAKRPETREKRLRELAGSCARGERLARFSR